MQERQPISNFKPSSMTGVQDVRRNVCSTHSCRAHVACAQTQQLRWRANAAHGLLRHTLVCGQQQGEEEQRAAVSSGAPGAGCCARQRIEQPQRQHQQGCTEEARKGGSWAEGRAARLRTWVPWRRLNERKFLHRLPSTALKSMHSPAAAGLTRVGCAVCQPEGLHNAFVLGQRIDAACTGQGVRGV